MEMGSRCDLGLRSWCPCQVHIGKDECEWLKLRLRPKRRTREAGSMKEQVCCLANR